jgi:hypothetical protein
MHELELVNDHIKAHQLGLILVVSNLPVARNLKEHIRVQFPLIRCESAPTRVADVGDEYHRTLFNFCTRVIRAEQFDQS